MTCSGSSAGQEHISTGQSGGVFPQLMRHQASDDDKLMAEHHDASTTVLIDSLWCDGMMMYAAAQASMLRTCTAWRGMALGLRREPQHATFLRPKKGNDVGERKKTTQREFSAPIYPVGQSPHTPIPAVPPVYWSYSNGARSVRLRGLTRRTRAPNGRLAQGARPLQTL